MKNPEDGSELVLRSIARQVDHTVAYVRMYVYEAIVDLVEEAQVGTAEPDDDIPLLAILTGLTVQKCAAFGGSCEIETHEYYVHPDVIEVVLCKYCLTNER